MNLQIILKLRQEENLIDSNTTYYTTLIKMPYYIYTALLAYYTKVFWLCTLLLHTGLELKKILPGELQKIQIQAEELLKILPGELKKIQILPEELKNILPGELLRSATRSMEDSTRTAQVELEILFRGWAQQAGQRSEETTDVQMLYSVAVTHFLTHHSSQTAFAQDMEHVWNVEKKMWVGLGALMVGCVWEL